MELQSTHPTRSELAAFAHGRVDEETLAAIEAHLRGCPDCLAALADLPADPFARFVRTVMADPLAAPCPDTRPADPDLPAGLADHPRYAVERKLGEGGMGAVYLAKHRLMRRPVALKVIRRRLLQHPGAVARFRGEITAVAALNHPSIAAAYDAEELDGGLLLVLEYVPGTDLAAHVRALGPLPPPVACGLVRDVAQALAYAHRRGLVHRDIKPQNLILTPDGGVKILDFGLATLRAEPEPTPAGTDAGETPFARAGITAHGQVLGTPEFMAPEQRTDARAVDARADVYSLGRTLQYLLTGTLLGCPAGEPPGGKPTPAAVQAVLDRMMALDPAGRYVSMEQVADALTPLCGAADRGSRRGLAAALLLVAILVAATGVLALWAGRPAGPTDAQEVHRFLGSESWVRTLAVSPDGSQLLAGGGDGVVRVWQMHTDHPPRELGRHEGAVLAVAFAADGRQALTGGFDFQMRLWDVATGRLVRSFAGHTDAVHAVAFAADGVRVASGGLDRRIRVWDRTTGAELIGWTAHEAGVMGVRFLPGDEFLVSCGNDQTVRLWHPGERREVRRFVGHTHEVMGLDVSPDGTRLVTGSHDGTVRVWEVGSGAELARQDGEMNVTSVAFTPNGRQVLFGGWVGDRVREGRLWDVASGRITAVLRGHTGRVSCVGCSPDGRHLLTGAEDGTVRLWRLP